MAEVGKIKKKKLWVPIVAPMVLQNKAIGDAYVVDPKSIIGKTVSVNLSSITSDKSHRDFMARFRIIEVGDNAKTEIIGFELGNSIIGRTIRKGKDRVDDSFIVRTKDNVGVRIKPYLQTNNYVARSVQTSLMKAIREYSYDFAKSRSYNEFIRDILSHKLQKEVKIKLNKITALKFIEIRRLEKIESESKKSEEPIAA